MDFPRLVDDLGLNSEEIILLRVFLKLKDNSEDEIKENFAIYRKFKEWTKKNPDVYPLLNNISKNLNQAQTQWLAIGIWWWDEYCNVRKKNSNPKEQDLFKAFKNV